jgi:hypothetical protein
MIAIPRANFASDGNECSHSQTIVRDVIGLLLQGKLRFQSLFKLSTVQPLFIGSTVMYWGSALVGHRVVVRRNLVQA